MLSEMKIKKSCSPHLLCDCIISAQGNNLELTKSTHFKLVLVHHCHCAETFSALLVTQQSENEMILFPSKEVKSPEITSSLKQNS